MADKAGITGRFAQARRLVLVAVVTMASGLWSPAAARGEDVCPEPNNAFQAACFLGPDADALGFISQPQDSDAYRFEVRDYGVTVQVNLADRPLPYGVNIADWNGDIIAGGEGGSVQTRLPLPGSYYIFVYSVDGQSSDSAPYRLHYGSTYATQPVPEVLYAAEYRGGERDVFTNSGTNRHVDETGEYVIEGGRVMFALTASGTGEEPDGATLYLWPEPPDPGPVVEDFSMVVDARLVKGTAAGYGIVFRATDEDNYYKLEVSIYDQQVTLSKIVGGELEPIVDWLDAPSVNTNGVNRTVLRMVKNEVRANINGQEVLRATDDTFARGALGYGVTTWGDPPTLTFDNVLVTTPTRR
jgi:hypothetical protein